VTTYTEKLDRPAWAQSANAGDCAMVSGSYEDHPSEQRGSALAIVYRSFGNLLLAHAGSSPRPSGIGSSHTHVALAWSAPDKLQVTIFGPHPDGTMIIHAQCDGGSVLVQNSGTVGIEGGTNQVNKALWLSAVDGQLAVQDIFEVRHTSMGIPMGGSSEQAWYRFQPKAQ
jgi:hypothetical protein